MSPLDSCFPRFSAKAKTFWTPVEKTPLSSKSELRNQEDEEEVEDEWNYAHEGAHDGDQDDGFDEPADY